MSMVGLYSRIQSIEAMVNELKISGVSTDSGFSSVPEEKVVDLTQLPEFNELTEKVKSLEVADAELSTKIADVPTLLTSFVNLDDFSALSAKVEKLEKLTTQMDKLNSKFDSLSSKVASLEAKILS
jgi:tetrahydromethanopterin S-methyltransferase subunit B